MIHFITGRAGSGKTRYIYEKVKTLVANGEQNVVLFVPEQASFETEKEMLSVLGVENQYSVDVLSFKRFCDRFYSVYKIEKEQCISEIGRTVLMSASLKACGGTLETFSRQSSDLNFAKTMISVYEQMKNFEITTDVLSDAAQKSDSILGAKLRDISTIFTQYEEKLKGEYYDPSDKLSRVAGSLDSNRFFENKTVFFDSFKGFTEQQMRVVERIIEQAKDVYFGFCLDKSRGNSAISPFSNIKSLIDRLKKTARENRREIASDISLDNSFRLNSQELRFLESSIYSNDEIAFEGENKNIKIYSALDPYDEADFVAREIHRLTREENYRYRDFAVVARNIEDYLPAIDAAFNKRNVAYFADRRRPAVTKSVFRLARYALKSARTCATDDIMGMLKTGIFGLSEHNVNSLENYTDIWQITRGWENKWMGDTLGANSKEEDLEKRLEYINDLRQTVWNPLNDFSNQLKSAVKAGDICSALYDFFEKISVIENLNKLTFSMEQNGDIDLASDEQQSYDAFIEVLDQIYMAVGENEVTVKEFEDLFLIAANACDIGEIPQRLDEVIVGAADRIRPKSPKVTFVLGANYDVFPRTVNNNTIFSTAELDMLIELGCAMSGGIDDLTDEHFLVYSLLSSPSEKLYISYSKADKSGKQIDKSEIIDMIEKLFSDCEFKFNFDIENECDAIDIVACDVNLTKGVSAAVDSYYSSKGDNALEVFFKQNKDVRLSQQVSKKCFGDEIDLSASKIDVYYQCRFKYLCQYVFKIKPLKTASVDVMERGTIVHYILEKMIEKYSSTPKECLELTDEQLSNQVSELMQKQLEKLNQGREFTSVEKFSQIKLVKTMVELVKRVMGELCNTDFKVYKTELKIGNKKGNPTLIPAYEVDINNGRKVVVTGIVDRVDYYKTENDTYLRIIDYKTGRKELNLCDVVKGQNIQMLLYMHAIISAVSKTSTDILPAGVYYMPARNDYVSVNKDEDKGKINAQLMDKLRYCGITTSNETVINAMDKTEDRYYSPVKLKYKKNDPEMLFTQEQFKLLGEKIDKLLIEMGNGLYESDFEATPITPEKSKNTVCDYCDYRAICGRQPDEEGGIIYKCKNSKIFNDLEAEFKEEDEEE